MKKFLFLFFTFLFINIDAFAEHICAPLINLDTSDEIEISFTDEDFPMLFSFKDEEKYIMSCFDAVLHPDNISDTDFTKRSNYYTVSIPIRFNVDITGYTEDDIDNLINEEFSYVNSLFEKYIAENPDYFYLMTGNYRGGVALSTYSHILYFQPIVCYDFTGFDGLGTTLKAQYDEMREKIVSIKNEICVSGMSDLDKILLAHDYITDNCVYYLAYDEDGTAYYGDGYSFNAYGVFINKKAVCQGYSFAYAALLEEMGISIDNIKQIRSSALNHQWNLVCFNGKWYHIDSTWDDPTSACYDMTDLTQQKTRHIFFLISSETNQALRKKSFDMDVYGFDDSITDKATSKEYESGYVFNSTLPGGGTIYGAYSYDNEKYVLTTDYKLYSNSEGRLKFVLNSLKASDYLLSQPYFEEVENGNVSYTTVNSLTDLNGTVCFRLFSSNADVNLTKTKNFVLCFYDKDGRLLQNISEKTSDSAFQSPFASASFPKNAYTFKILCLDDMSPLSNSIILTR